MRIKQTGGFEVLTKEGKWVEVSKTDMSHLKDAVKAWNEWLYKTGPKSKEVRKFMLDSKNYELEHYKTNRSRGGKEKENYRPPEQSAQDVKEGEGG